MTDKELIKQELDTKNLKDFKAVLTTPEGRRFFYWLKDRCGENNTSFTGNSTTFFNEGQRNIALILDACCKAIGMDGVDLMHQAEKEYIILQMEIAEDIRRKQKQGGK